MGTLIQILILLAGAFSGFVNEFFVPVADGVLPLKSNE
jgi:hypothetical protein